MKEMNDPEQGMKLIFSQYLAGWLMQKNYKLQGMRPDKVKKGKNVFLFQWSPEIEKDIEEYNKREVKVKIPKEEKSEYND